MRQSQHTWLLFLKVFDALEEEMELTQERDALTMGPRHMDVED